LSNNKVIEKILWKLKNEQKRRFCSTINLGGEQIEREKNSIFYFLQVYVAYSITTER